jgi:carboxymethylenebutenolidase
VYAVSEVVAQEPLIAAFVGYGSFAAPTCSTVPIMLHLNTNMSKPTDYSNQSTTKHFYLTSSTYFVLPQATQYDHASASLAHSRTLAFLRQGLGGPLFDLEAIWDEHTYFEFEVRSVAKTMGTMVVSLFVDLLFTVLKNCITQAEPYVNHIPSVRLMVNIQWRSID